VTFATRLGVVERTKSIGSGVFDFLEELLDGLPATGKPIAQVVESG